MDINKLVIVTPNVGGDTLTARETHDEHSNQWPAKLQRGKVYRAVELYVGMYRLQPVDPFPFTVPAGKSVWADSDYLPEYVGDPDPAPVPVGDGSLKSLAAKIGQALIEWSEE